MIIGIEFSKTQDGTGKKFYRIAPVILQSTPYASKQVKAYLTAALIIFSFVYYTTQIASALTGVQP